MKKTLALLVLMTLLLAAAAAQAAPVVMAGRDDVPQLTEEGFLPEGEDARYFIDREGGCWYYVDQTVRIEILRSRSSDPLLTYYIADIVCAEGTGLYTVSYNKDRPGRTNGLPQKMAEEARAVYAQSGDFYSYRVAHDRYPGNIVRDGKVIHNKSYSAMVHATPNLATMGFFPSGRAEVNEAWEMSAKDYVSRGATTVVAFGPILIRDGEAQDVSDPAYTHREPRSCIGVIESGHYVGLLVEGRKSHSAGATLAECAALLLDMGCSDAINLDGGNTAAMLFMGESVQMAENGGVDTNDRSIPDILAVGRY